MSHLKAHTIKMLRDAREKILSIPKDRLTGQSILSWANDSQAALDKGETVSGLLMRTNVNHFMQGFWDETDSEVCLELRDRIVGLIDQAIKGIDETQQIIPILDGLILKVADTKLATLLREFNDARTAQPNLAASGFRTILALIIRERAKRVDSQHRLATKNDINFEPDINEALGHPTLFNSAEQKLIKRYVSGGDKDSFDNVVHKPDFLTVKEELEDAVNLLNRLLPTIVD